MTEPIVSIEEIKRRAHRDFMSGVTENPFNWHSAAHQAWNNEFRLLREDAATKQTAGGV